MRDDVRCLRSLQRSDVGTFSYHNLSIDDMILQLKPLQITEIEMSRGEFMLMKPPTPDMCNDARAKFDRAGIRCVSYYTATIKNNTDLDYAVRYARLLGPQRFRGRNRRDSRRHRQALSSGKSYFRHSQSLVSAEVRL